MLGQRKRRESPQAEPPGGPSLPDPRPYGGDARSLAPFVPLPHSPVGNRGGKATQSAPFPEKLRVGHRQRDGGGTWEPGVGVELDKMPLFIIIAGAPGLSFVRQCAERPPGLHFPPELWRAFNSRYGTAWDRCTSVRSAPAGNAHA